MPTLREDRKDLGSNDFITQFTQMLNDHKCFATKTTLLQEVGNSC